MGSAGTLEYSDRTDIGCRRSNNQDAKGVVEPWNREQYRRRGWLFVVADGMGAHAAGEMASALAVQEVTGTYEKLASRSPPLALRTSIEEANAKIHAKGETSPDLKGMGTTCTALALVPRGALVGHVGDSRAYRVRGGTIEQLSQDHSLAWELEAKAGDGESVLPAAVPKNIITRSMGPHERVKVDIEGPFPVEADDVFVLCSDGLSGQVADAEIGALAAALPPAEAADALVGLALARGAPDNVTVVVVRAGEREQSKTSPADPPWLLEDRQDPAGGRRSAVPWKLLAVAAASLLGALVCYPESDVMRGVLPDGLRPAIGWASVGLFVLLFISSLLGAVLGFLVPAGGGGRVLRPGHALGKGPYRSYDCAPTAQLVDGVAASVESAAGGLDAGSGRACAAALARARAAADSPTAALVEAGAALAAYRRAVEAAR